MCTFADVTNPLHHFRFPETSPPLLTPQLLQPPNLAFYNLKSSPSISTVDCWRTAVLQEAVGGGRSRCAPYSHPVIIFLHYWCRGPADKLATGFKAALDELGKGNKQ